MITNIITDKILIIVAIIVCLLLGFGLGYLSKALSDKITISDLEKKVAITELAKNTMQKQWEIAVNELNKTKVLLNDTLAALELLRKYQLIDNDTKNKINKIDNTLVDGKPTQDTYDEFKKLVEEMNKKNGEYNTGSTIVDTQSFIDLTKKAEELFQKATDMVIEYEK